MLSIGEHSHGDLNWGFKMSGYGDHDVPYERMDHVMLRVIQSREDASGLPDSSVSEELPDVPHRWTEKDADVGVFKTSNGPNKQQRGQMARQQVQWNKERTQALRKRREQAQDWVSNGLSELIEHRDYIDNYGLEGYFTKTIAKSEALKAKMAEVQPGEEKNGITEPALSL